MAVISRTTISPVQEAGCPKILFSDEGGIYWLRGANLARAKKLLNLSYDQKNLGFDVQMASIYAHDLTEQGVTIGIIRGNTVRTITRPQTSKPEKGQSKTIWLAPTLLFGRKELAKMNRHVNGQRFMVETFMQRMRTETIASDASKELGPLYVYKVAENLYEVEWELTKTPKAIVEALALAASQTEQPLRCELVEPKSKRVHSPRQTRKTVNSLKPQFLVSEPVAYGQLGFEI